MTEEKDELIREIVEHLIDCIKFTEQLWRTKIEKAIEKLTIKEEDVGLNEYYIGVNATLKKLKKELLDSEKDGEDGCGITHPTLKRPYHPSEKSKEVKK